MGFDGRVFLLDSEYETYMRRMPVRYIRHKISNVCAICGKEATNDNPLEKAHLIPFNLGIKKYRLTPDFLDRKENMSQHTEERATSSQSFRMKRY